MCLTVVDTREAREMLSEGITDDSGKSIMEFNNVNSQKIQKIILICVYNFHNDIQSICNNNINISYDKLRLNYLLYNLYNKYKNCYINIIGIYCFIFIT